jgi:uncharacterized protein YciI
MADVVVKTTGVEFFCYHRDRPGSMTLREELLEEHWSYMDRYTAEMIARGPTLAGDTPTGSVHIVGLPDPAAARAFAFDEPGYQAGVYRDVLLRRWRNLLGRTMWDFPGGRTGGNRYLVLASLAAAAVFQPVDRHSRYGNSSRPTPTGNASGAPGLADTGTWPAGQSRPGVMGAAAGQRKNARAIRTPAADRACRTPTWSARKPMAGGPARKAR